MKKYKQLIFSPIYGDCYRACMATLLQLPPEVLPNDHSPFWPFTWERFLAQFGIGLSPTISAKGPIWTDRLWIASVPSLNLEGSTHAIVMHGQKVYHDPSTKKRYKTGLNLLGKDVVLSGRYLVVTDIELLSNLGEYRNRLEGKE